MNAVKNIFLVAGARPNFMKVAPLQHQLDKRPEVFRTRLIHTGQHYDADMSDIFFHDLDCVSQTVFSVLAPAAMLSRPEES